MDRPASSAAEDVSRSKAALLRTIRPLRPEDLVLGQYSRYREEEGVAPHSNASTFAACVLSLNSERWSGVPVLMRAGKGLRASGTFVRVHFKGGTWSEGGTGGVLTLRVQPDPGYSLAVGLADLKFSYGGRLLHMILLCINNRPVDCPGEPLPDAYEVVLRALLDRDHKYFISENEVLASWAVFDSALASAEDSKLQPLVYQTGSEGLMHEVRDLASKHGVFWSDTPF